MRTPLHKQLTNYIQVHGQVSYDDIQGYAKSNGYHAYTAIRRLQEVRQPEHRNYDAEIGTVEEGGTIRWYIYKPAFISHQTQNLPRSEDFATVPAIDSPLTPKQYEHALPPTR